MKTIITTLLIVVLTGLSFSVFAQTNDVQESEVETTTTSNDLTAELIQETQKPGSKEVTFIMKLSSNIFADRVKVTWTLTGGSTFTEDSKTLGQLRVEPGQTYEIPVTVIPSPSNFSEIFASAEAFQVDGTIITTVRKNYTTNALGEILPITPEYKQAKQNYQIMSTLQTGVLICGGLAIAGFVIYRFYKYLNRDDIAAYDKSHRR